MLEMLEKTFSQQINLPDPIDKPDQGEECMAALITARTYVSPEQSVERVGKLFLDHHELQSIPVVQQKIPVGIVYRLHFMDIFLSPFGRDLYGRKPISQFMDTDPIVVEKDMPIQTASQYITQNMRLPTVQDFIITQKGEYRGIGTLIELLEKITTLKINQLKAENMRLAAEVEVTQRLQQMLLPKQAELKKVNGLDIAGFMKPADEVGGDYYDVLCHKGRVLIGIGDVTGHGLESGVVMLMVQAAVRTLLTNDETDQVRFLNTLNRVIYDNVERMACDKNLTLTLIDYQEGLLKLIGQHESLIIIRSGGDIELVDTIDLGFPIGLTDDIADFIGQVEITLNTNDVAILYTDGITEALNAEHQEYGLQRLCDVACAHWELSAEGIKSAIICDVQDYIGNQKVLDDITLLVLKQK